MDFGNRLAKWYQNNKRDLPWRHSNDPYCIWLSEIILQQTRVNQGLEYYLKFVEKYPDVFALARHLAMKYLNCGKGWVITTGRTICWQPLQ